MLAITGVSHDYANGARATADGQWVTRQPLRSGVQTIELRIAVKPHFAGAGPYNFIIDRAADVNVIEVN